MRTADLSSLAGCKVIAIKETVNRYPQADVVYGCDPAWWKHRRGLPEFRGLKVAWESGQLGDYPDIRRVRIGPCPAKTYTDKLLVDEVGVIGGGGNSAFQALNLAVQWGARKILLFGVDMYADSPDHWYGRNIWAGANNPGRDNFERWISAFEGAAPVLKSLGVDVINCNPSSAVRCFHFA